MGGADLLRGGGGQTFFWGGGQEDGIAMIGFSHDIYCAQSNVKWGGGRWEHGVNRGDAAKAPPPP